ncbi:hypothetical protein DL771_002372 [Monosporascus sp. 5C6A]|nr:hypothetical protein DL771_002372 [Monosporascus sp. 5C6A]
MDRSETAVDSLCRRCEERVDPDVLRHDDRDDDYMGSFSDVQARADCPFCRLVVAAITQFRRHASTEPALALEGSEDVNVSWWHSPAGYSVNLALPGTRICFVEPECGSPISEYSERGDDGYWTTLAIRRARIVGDFPFICPPWLENCKEYHGEQCEPSLNIFQEFASASWEYRFRLIDVNAMAVVEFSQLDLIPLVLLRMTPDYAALSYVWGGVTGLQLLKQNFHELTSPNGLEHRRSEIPRTVLDAIKLTKSMAKYLWVDALCLIQDDPSDKQRSIPRMHLIYGGATVTIIAAAGPNANTGLPGVGDTPRRGKQIVEVVKPGTEMAILNDVNDMLQISHYAGRGWTFQEQLLANRTIIFAPDDSIYFRCLHSVWSEDTNDDERPSAMTFEPDYLYLAFEQYVPAALAYDSLVLHYTNRSFTNQSDALDAFAGLQKLLETRFDGPFLEGIPSCAFDFFILFTGHFVTLKRRGGFPSWSWAGWIGNVKLDQRGQLHHPEGLAEWLEKRTWIRWYKSNESGQLEAIWNPVSRPTRVSRANYKSCNAPLAERKGSRGPEMFERGDLIDRNGKLVGSVHLDDHFVTPDKLSRPFELIILSETSETHGGCALVDERGYFSDNWDLYWVMLLKWDEDTGVAERRGLGQLYQEALATSFEPGPGWKEITLA